MSPDNVINIDTEDWSPEQVARWVQQQVDGGNVELIVVAIALKEETEDGLNFLRMWSSSTCQAMLYLTTWLQRNTIGRSFG